MDRKFTALYTKFTNAHTAHNYSKMVEIAGAYKCEAITGKDLQYHLYLFRAIFDAVRRCVKDTSPVDIAKFVTQFESVFEAAAKYEGCQSLLNAVNTLTKPEYLHGNPSLLAIAATSAGSSIKQWLRRISRLLADVKICPTTADEGKAAFLSMTQSALLFFKLETESKATRFTETKHYFECCTRLEFMRRDKYCADYVQCFKLLEIYVKAWEDGAADWQENMNKVIELVIAAPKTLRATVVQDVVVTLAEFIQINKRQLCAAVGADQIRTLFKLMLKMVDILRHTKYEKVFCTWCKGNVGLHEVDSLANVAFEVYQSAIEKDVVLDATVCEAFGKIVAMNMVSLSKLECQLASTAQPKQVQEMRTIKTRCSSKAKANYAVPMFAHIFHHLADIQLTKVKFSSASSFNEMYLLRDLYDMLKSAEMLTELTHVAYFMLAHTLVAQEPNTKLIHSTIYEVNKLQTLHKDGVPFETPYDYYTSLARGGDPVFRMKFPPNVSVVEMLLTHVKICGLYGMAGLEEFTNKCVYQLTMLAKKQEPLRCLRFIFHLDRFNWEAVSDRCQRQLKILRASVDAHDANEMRAVSLLVGAFDLYMYLNRVYELSQKYAGMSLMDEFNCTDRPTVFHEQTLAFEREQAQLLFNAKKRMESFLEFYLALSEPERLAYEEESKYLLKALKDIARNFLCRDYERETMEAFVALYRLAKVVDDQFGMINACAYFAEHSLAFHERFENQDGLDLAAMLNQCYVHLVQHIQNITAISIRKQKELFYCLLNIALYHFADHRIDDGKKIMQFVKMQMRERNITYGVVEMKYFAVLFEMITKYQQPSRFSAIEFGEYLIQKIRSSIFNVPAEDSINIPLIMFNAVPAIVTFCLNRYESSSAVSESLLLSVLKFSIRSGFVRRSLNALMLIGMLDLYQEKWQMSEKRLGFLEQMCQICKNSEFSFLGKSKLSIESIECTIDSTDPIRRDASISVRCVSPFKVITNNVESHMCRYLQTSHTKNCSCDTCYDAYNRFVLLQIGSLYTRITYLNETDAQTKLTIQSEIYDYWSEHLKTSQTLKSNDSFLVEQARMLMWCAHVQWKFEKNLPRAKIMLDESVEWLRKAQNYDRAMEHDLLGQIALLNNELMVANSANRSKVNALNRKKGFIDQESPAKKTKTQPAAAAAAANKTNRPFINILECTVPDVRWKPPKFQIHDDDSPESEPAKKPTKKATSKARPQKNAKNEENPIVDLTSPPSKDVIAVSDSSPEPSTQKPAIKPTARPIRGKCVPTASSQGEEKSTQPTKTTRRRGDRIEVESAPVTRATRPRRERK